MAEGILFERATAADYDEIVEFANFVFSYAHEPHEFKTLISKAYGEDRTHWPIHFVARENGRIRGLVGLMPFPQRVLGETLQMGFIGTVSVHPYSRSKGYMKKLMAMTNDYARDNGFDLLALGGQRQRYEYYGYEPGGAMHALTITATNCRHALKDVEADAVSFAPFESQRAQMDALFSIYESGVVAGARPREDFEQICGTWRNQPLAILLSGSLAGYLIASPDHSHILELRLRSPEALYPAIKAYFTAFGQKRVCVERRTSNGAVAPAAAHLRKRFIRTKRVLPVVDYARVVRTYLKLKQHIEGDLPDGRLALGLAEEGKTLLICASRGEIACEITQDTPDILLSRLEAQNLLLAPTPFVDVSCPARLRPPLFPAASVHRCGGRILSGS